MYFGKAQGTTNLQKHRETINHLMHMDDIKIFAKNEKEQKTLIQTKKYAARI